MTDHAHQPVRQCAGRFPCEHPDCELRYNDRGAALACCSDRSLPGALLAEGGRSTSPSAPQCPRRGESHDRNELVRTPEGLRTCPSCGAAVESYADGGQPVRRPGGRRYRYTALPIVAAAIALAVGHATVALVSALLAYLALYALVAVDSWWGYL